MGGKLWTALEEQIFWTVVVPQSQRRIGLDEHNVELSWEELVEVMNKAMLEALGEDDIAKLPRKYTKLSLCKFFFQPSKCVGQASGSVLSCRSLNMAYSEPDGLNI